MTQRLPVTKIIQLDRIISWILVVVSILTIFTGYSLTRHLGDRGILLQWHLVSEIAFIALLITHILLTFLIPAYWRNLWQKLIKRNFSTTNWLKLIQRLSGYSIIFLAGVVIITGLDFYGLGLRTFLPFIQHIRFDLALTMLIAVHIAVGGYFALKRQRIKGPWVNFAILAFLIGSALFIGVFDTRGFEPFIPVIPDDGGTPIDDIISTLPNGTIPDPPQNTKPELNGTILVGPSAYSFNPVDVVSVRPDIFNPGYFSMFDILVHLKTRGDISMDYHYDEDLRTHVIDSLNGQPNWWYDVIYDGGWSEQNNFRMDLYPWKDRTFLRVYQETEALIATFRSKFREEVDRLEANSGSIIIPEVTIHGNSFTKVFHNLNVTAHNLRNDVFTIGTVTAIDVILSLADNGLITYEIQWYETILGSIVKSYWVETIDQDKASGGCGWVYETGYKGIIGNHIHLPSDTRVLNSPDYALFYWICL